MQYLIGITIRCVNSYGVGYVGYNALQDYPINHTFRTKKGN